MVFVTLKDGHKHIELVVGDISAIYELDYRGRTRTGIQLRMGAREFLVDMTVDEVKAKVEEALVLEATAVERKERNG